MQPLIIFIVSLFFLCYSVIVCGFIFIYWRYPFEAAGTGFGEIVRRDSVQ